MRVCEQIDNDKLTVQLDGSLDESSSDLVENAMNDVLKKDFKDIYLDMKHVRYVSSIGIRVLILAHKRAVKSGKKIILVSMSEKVREILNTVGILSIFALEEAG